MLNQYPKAMGECCSNLQGKRRYSFLLDCAYLFQKNISKIQSMEIFFFKKGLKGFSLLNILNKPQKEAGGSG